MTFRLSPANRGHLHLIIGLIEEAAHWLRGKGTDQWQRPWPNREERDARILDDLRAVEAKPHEPKTWIAWEDGAPAATITTDKDASPLLWTEEEREQRAIYVHRLIVSRRYAGIGLGAELLDWAGRQAVKEHQALWIRIDVWTENKPLHRYYERQGFTHLRSLHHLDYPSGALFQKATDQIPETGDLMFREERQGRLATPNGRQIHPGHRSAFAEQTPVCNGLTKAQLFR